MSLKNRINALELQTAPKKMLVGELGDLFENELLGYLFDADIPEPALPGESVARYRRRKGNIEAQRAVDYGWTFGAERRVRMSA